MDSLRLQYSIRARLAIATGCYVKRLVAAEHVCNKNSLLQFYFVDFSGILLFQ